MSQDTAHPFRTIEVSDPTLAPEGLVFVTVKSAALGQRADVLPHRRLHGFDLPVHGAELRIDLLHVDRRWKAGRDDQEAEETQNGRRDACDRRGLSADEGPRRDPHGSDHERQREAQEARNQITTLRNCPEHHPPLTPHRVSNGPSDGQVTQSHVEADGDRPFRAGS